MKIRGREVWRKGLLGTKQCELELQGTTGCFNMEATGPFWLSGVFPYIRVLIVILEVGSVGQWAKDVS